MFNVPARSAERSASRSVYRLREHRKEFLPLTVLRVHREVGLPLQDAVHQLGAVPVRLIVRVIGGYSDDRRTCEEREQAAFRRERSSD